MIRSENPTYQAAHSLGQDHCANSRYLPEQNPHAEGTPDHAAWHEGYEQGWDSTFFAKRASRHQLPLFPNNQQTDKI